MKFRTKSLFIAFVFIFLLGIFPSFAQLQNSSKKDTVSIPVDSFKFFYFPENGFPYGNLGSATKLTNKLNDFQNFQTRQAGTGNAGGPEKQLLLNSTQNINFDRGVNNFSSFGFNSNNRRFYTSLAPYTKIQFILGTKQELNVSVVHAHPFGKNCNVAFGFDRIRSTGFYQRQNTNNTSVNLNGWYRSPGRRYAMLSDIYWTSINVAENGGIAKDSSFEHATQLDRRLIAVNLSSAETQLRQRGIWLKQYWSFGAISDTIQDLNDSTNFKTKIQPSWAIVHTIQLSDEKYIYSDQNPSSGFYSTILMDSTETKDSTNVWKLANGIWIERFDIKSGGTRRLFSGKIGLKQELGEISADTIYKHFANNLIDGALRINLSKKWCDNITVNGSFVFLGANNGDYSLNAKWWTQAFFNNRVFGFTASHISLVHPSFLFSNFSGNNFKWKNDFYQTGVHDFDAGLFWLGKETTTVLTGAFIQYAQPLYFGADLLPTQFSGTINAFTANLNCLVGSKTFKLKSDFTWNSLPYNSPIRLPEFIVRESAFADFYLFKKALQMQTGIEGTWFSAYYADAYNPAVAQFYIQNTQKLASYVFLTPWVSIKVKSVRIFVKADHLNAGLMGRKYYLIPQYPQNDFALKFGLSWVFND